MLAVGVSADRIGERCLHTAGCGAVAAIGFVGVASLQNPVTQVTSLALIAAGSLAYYPVLFCLATMLLDGSAAAAGIALINAISSVGGFAGPWFVGAVKDETALVAPVESR